MKLALFLFDIFLFVVKSFILNIDEFFAEVALLLRPLNM